MHTHDALVNVQKWTIVCYDKIFHQRPPVLKYQIFLAVHTSLYNYGISKPGTKDHLSWQTLLFCKTKGVVFQNRFVLLSILSRKISQQCMTFILLHAPEILGHPRSGMVPDQACAGRCSLSAIKHSNNRRIDHTWGRSVQFHPSLEHSNVASQQQQTGWEPDRGKNMFGYIYDMSYAISKENNIDGPK